MALKRFSAPFTSLSKMF